MRPNVFFLFFFWILQRWRVEAGAANAALCFKHTPLDCPLGSAKSNAAMSLKDEEELSTVNECRRC